MVEGQKEGYESDCDYEDEVAVLDDPNYNGNTNNNEDNEDSDDDFESKDQDKSFEHIARSVTKQTSSASNAR